MASIRQAQKKRALALVNDIEGLPARSVWTRVCAQKQPVLVPSVGIILPAHRFAVFHDLDLWKSLNVVL